MDWAEGGLDMGKQIQPTGHEVFFDKNDIIVSKTDIKGKITYTNHVFREIAGYSGKELDGAPHSIIRHPDMPRTVFKLLWDKLALGEEVFAYVKNMAKTGDHYWVFAHVTPSYDGDGKLLGYHSSRRVPNRTILENHIIPLYDQLLELENSQPNRKDGLNKSTETLHSVLGQMEKSYDEFILTL